MANSNQSSQSQNNASRKLNPVQAKRDFKEPQPDREKQWQVDKSSQPVTRAQVDALEARRRKLSAEKTLDMKGPMGNSVKADEERQLAKKIAEMNNKLNSKKMGKRFNRSR